MLKKNTFPYASRALSRRSLIAILLLAYFTVPFCGIPQIARASTVSVSGSKKLLQDILYIDQDAVIAHDLLLVPGAQIHIKKGATLSIKGDFQAPAALVFTGPGKVDMLQSPARSAKPEWWGAVMNDFSVDCGPAITACLDAHIALDLGPGDYYVPDGVTINQHNRRISGTGRTKDFGGTRLVRSGPHGPVITIGTEQSPGAINNYTKGIEICRIELTRTEAGSAPQPGRPAAIGVKICHVLDCRLEGLRSNEHSVGYEATNAVRTILEDCVAFRSIASKSGKGDMFIGFDMHDNASLYLKDCNVSIGGYPVLEPSIGARLSGNIADSFLIRFETRAVREGILVDGRSLGSSESAHQINVHIDTPVLDQCSEYGLHLVNLSATASLDITNPYIAVAPGDGTAIQITECKGSLDISGGQITATIPTRDGDSQYGLAILRSSGIGIRGLKIMQFPHPCALESSRFIDATLSVIHGQSRTSGPAINIFDSEAIYMRPVIRGNSQSYENGILISGRSKRIKIDVTGIDQNTLSNGEIARFDGSNLKIDAQNILIIK